MKKVTVILIVIGFLSLSTLVSASTTLVDTLDYKETKWVSIPGNTTLAFKASDTGRNDLTLLIRIFSPESNLTIYNVRSEAVDINSSFINNTKNYTYSFHNNTYIIRVNYTSVSTPKSIAQLLAEKDKQIANLTRELFNYSTRLSTLTILVNETLIKYIAAKNRLSPLENLTFLLRENLNESENNTESLRNRLDIVNQEKLNLTAKLNDQMRFTLNIPSLIGGIVLTLLLIVLSSRYGYSIPFVSVSKKPTGEPRAKHKREFTDSGDNDLLTSEESKALKEPPAEEVKE
jgi:hypothetical protein